MDVKAFLDAYNAGRNGCNYFVKHILVAKFQYTDGVQACAAAGCYWLVDIVATEVPAVMLTKHIYQAMLEVHVAKSKAVMQLVYLDDREVPPAWQKFIPWTDMPDGDYVFEVVDEGERVAMCLLSEH